MKIIERSDAEYMADMRRIYEDEMKPMLLQGISLTKAFRILGVGNNKNSRKHRELRQMALDDGYQLRR